MKLYRVNNGFIVRSDAPTPKRLTMYSGYFAVVVEDENGILEPGTELDSSFFFGLKAEQIERQLQLF